MNSKELAKKLIVLAKKIEDGEVFELAENEGYFMSLSDKFSTIVRSRNGFDYQFIIEKDEK